MKLCLDNDSNKDDLKVAKEELLEPELAIDLADFFKVFGDQTRIRILSLLSKHTVCVHQIAQLLDLNQSAISHQLKILRQNKLVKYERVGKHSYYSLADEHVNEVFANGLEHIME